MNYFNYMYLNMKYESPLDYSVIYFVEYCIQFFNFYLLHKNTCVDGSTSGLNNGIFTAVFLTLNNTIISTATITNIPLSHHNSAMQCLTTITTSHLETIKIAGMIVNIYYN